MSDIDLENTLTAVRAAVERRASTASILAELSSGLNEIGRKYERGEAFLTDLIMAGEIMRETMKYLESKPSTYEAASLGRILIGTVEGDIHDLGKNLVSALLRGSGFIVRDLGVDISPVGFLGEINAEKPDILGLSSLLTTTMIKMKDTVEIFRINRVRETLKVVVGGAPVSEEFAKRIGADAYGGNAFQAIDVCKGLLRK